MADEKEVKQQLSEKIDQIYEQMGGRDPRSINYDIIRDVVDELGNLIIYLEMNDLLGEPDMVEGVIGVIHAFDRVTCQDFQMRLIIDICKEGFSAERVEYFLKFFTYQLQYGLGFSYYDEMIEKVSGTPHQHEYIGLLEFHKVITRYRHDQCNHILKMFDLYKPKTVRELENSSAASRVAINPLRTGMVSLKRWYDHTNQGAASKFLDMVNRARVKV